MATTHLQFDSFRLSWRTLYHKLYASPERGRDCVHLHGAWRRLHFRIPGVWLEGNRYCMSQCLERALVDMLGRTGFVTSSPPLSHRVPLGLFLVSRQQLTAGQLQTALAAQRATGRGRIGEWLQTLGFATEQQVTAALARQWSCPVLPPTSSVLDTNCVPQIPFGLLKTFAMIPVAYVKTTARLHVAFAERIEYTALYAIERMLGCHTEPCLAVPSFVRRHMDALSSRRTDTEITFACFPDRAECSRIIRSYCVRLAASKVRLVPCGPHIWVRLLRKSHPPLDLVLLSSQT